MTGARHKPKPTFVWQAVLILLPVLILAFMGWTSLRQDRAIAEREASDRAQGIADDLAGRLWAELIENARNGSNAVTFQVDASGSLLAPPEAPGPPEPHPLDLARLNETQMRQWQSIAGPADGTATNQLELCREFLNSNPPRDFAAIAMYQLGLLQIEQKLLDDAAATLATLIERYPEAQGESGLPLEPLARFKLFQIGPRPTSSQDPEARRVYDPSFNRRNAISLTERTSAALDHFESVDSLCSNLVFHPTLLTPHLFQHLLAPIESRNNRAGDMGDGWNGIRKQDERPAIEAWHRTWERHETARALFAAAQAHLRPKPGLVPIGASENPGRPHPDSQERPGNVPQVFWIRTEPPLPTHFRLSPEHSFEDQHWFAVSFDSTPSNCWIACSPESELGFRVSTTVSNITRLPHYFGVAVDLAGKRLREFAPDLRLWHYDSSYVGKGGGTRIFQKHSEQEASTLLASSSRAINDVDSLKVGVYLTNPSALFHSQRIRARWFSALLLAALAAALVGLAAAWRSFRRQLRLNEMKSDFVSSVSHELRAPIASVRLMAESLERGTIQEPQKQGEYFRFIVQECRRLSSLVENVLDFSRIEQGRKQYEFEPTDLFAMVNQTVNLMQPYAVEKAVSLKLETLNIEHQTDDRERTSSFELNVDGKAIQQALVNLIDNAIKHSPKGETVTVGLQLHRRDELRESPSSAVESGTRVTRPSEVESGTRVTRPSLNLFVSDHGPGIPADEHEKIFERFYRRGSELRRETQGVGIGLSIVKHIVEAHGGRVRVDSAPGQGSRFTIELPLAFIPTADEHP